MLWNYCNASLVNTSAAGLRGKQVSRVGCRHSTELLHWFLCEYIQTLQSHCENVRLLSEILKSELATHVFCNNAFVLSTQGIFFASLMCVVQYETVRLWLIFYGHINFYTFLKLLVIILRWSEDTCKFEAHLAFRPFQWGDNCHSWIRDIMCPINRYISQTDVFFVQTSFLNNILLFSTFFSPRS